MKTTFLIFGLTLSIVAEYSPPCEPIANYDAIKSHLPDVLKMTKPSNFGNSTHVEDDEELKQALESPTNPVIFIATFQNYRDTSCDSVMNQYRALFYHMWRLYPVHFISTRCPSEPCSHFNVTSFLTMDYYFRNMTLYKRLEQGLRMKNYIDDLHVIFA